MPNDPLRERLQWIQWISIGVLFIVLGISLTLVVLRSVSPSEDLPSGAIPTPTSSPESPNTVSEELDAINFVQVGTLTFDTSGPGQDRPYLSYRSSPNAPTTTVELILDEHSICGSRTGALPCMAMSASFDMAFGGKRAVIEAVDQQKSLVVRRLRIADEGETIAIPSPGPSYIPWSRTISLLQACQVRSAIQAHDLTIYLVLKDGTEQRTVEPVIDEIFRHTNDTRQKCGDIQLGTE